MAAIIKYWAGCQVEVGFSFMSKMYHERQDYKVLGVRISLIVIFEILLGPVINSIFLSYLSP